MRFVGQDSPTPLPHSLTERETQAFVDAVYPLALRVAWKCEHEEETASGDPDTAAWRVTGYLLDQRRKNPTRAHAPPEFLVGKLVTQECRNMVRRAKKVQRNNWDSLQARGVVMARDDGSADVAGAGSADSFLLSEDLENLVRAGIARMPEPRRGVAQMAVIERRPYVEIAARLKLSRTNVGYHVCMAMRDLEVLRDDHLAGNRPPPDIAEQLRRMRKEWK